MHRQVVDEVKYGDPSGEKCGSTGADLGSNLLVESSAFAILPTVDDKLDQIWWRLEVRVLQILETLV